MIKQFIGTITSTTKAGGADEPSMIVTTNSPDRDGDRVLAEGADLDGFRKNPVLMWSHDLSALPIGTVTGLDIEPGRGLAARWRWASHPFAQEVKSAWDEGIVRAASIGFIGHEATPNAFGGRDHSRWELCEVSLVAVPANPQATRRVKALWRKTYEDRPQPAHPARPGGVEPGYAIWCVNCGAAMSDDSWRFCPACGTARATGAAAPTDATTGNARAWDAYLAKARQEDAMWAGVTSDDLKEIVSEAAAQVLPQLKREVWLEATGQID